MTGKLIGVGLGPGAPDLITLRSARAIEAAKVIAYPALPGTESFARRIAAVHISENTHEIVMEIPMTTARGPAQAAYDQGAARIAEALDLGQDVVVLCEGDPFFYGSFMYLHARLAGRYEVEVVPGVTSVSAAAARAGQPLTARNDVLTTVPAPLDDDTIRQRIESADSFAILKVGRHLARIRALLGALGLADSATYVERATLADERILPLSDAPDPAPYFSMILVTKGADPWLTPPS
ncbi:precorrin-2 C(20)-methyltransferase [Sinisalibacter aestuarii]|uniref:Precorrin-2 C(20)-methyltransferase n=1 Tax=Sinisalibacter aestuarii TaxID=2949426 RepID=A0ABQ5LVE0_9RHOB|nr:precorrin-2 C(20)-methyltransferase [Sinisalibacter aestuarii]GKY88854.1 precorrin-2 C(20)-methyltransferase [Sinisalibacter aestuarii]